MRGRAGAYACAGAVRAYARARLCGWVCTHAPARVRGACVREGVCGRVCVRAGAPCAHVVHAGGVKEKEGQGQGERIRKEKWGRENEERE